MEITTKINFLTTAWMLEILVFVNIVVFISLVNITVRCRLSASEADTKRNKEKYYVSLLLLQSYCCLYEKCIFPYLEIAVQSFESFPSLFSFFFRIFKLINNCHFFDNSFIVF